MILDFFFKDYVCDLLAIIYIISPLKAVMVVLQSHRIAPWKVVLYIQDKHVILDFFLFKDYVCDLLAIIDIMSPLKAVMVALQYQGISSFYYID